MFLIKNTPGSTRPSTTARRPGRGRVIVEDVGQDGAELAPGGLGRRRLPGTRRSPQEQKPRRAGGRARTGGQSWIGRPPPPITTADFVVNQEAGSPTERCPHPALPPRPAIASCASGHALGSLLERGFAAAIVGDMLGFTVRRRG
jgi:hypothetical protein